MVLGRTLTDIGLLRGATMDSYEFTAELWIWDARKEEGWTFVSVPPEESEEIDAYAASRPRAGFGSVRVSVTVGGSTWQTSVFPGGDGRYALPIKKSVRRAEGIEAGDAVTVGLRIAES
jgi:Domain of unknown function (DUF1905)